MAAQLRFTQTDGKEVAINVAFIDVIVASSNYNKGATLIAMNSGRNIYVEESYDTVADAVSDILDQEANRN